MTHQSTDFENSPQPGDNNPLAGADFNPASRRNIFVGVAWPYVNGDLHIGHLAGYLIPADITARFQRMRGNSVLMASGSDCYGTPITVEADKRGISPEELVAEYHPRIQKLFGDLGLTFDIYTQTTTPNHAKVVQGMFVDLLEKKLIFKDTSLQYYSEQEKRFLPDRYVEGTCPHCSYVESRSDQCDGCGSPLASGELLSPVSRNTKTPVGLRPTEHYFLDWPKLQGFLEHYAGAHIGEWRDWVTSETKKWLGEGLEPRAITRDLNWGVKIPNDRIPADMLILDHENKRIYVWFEAVIGYLSASLEWASLEKDRKWEVFWHNPEAWHYYFMGKDNLVFHSLFWPGQLHGHDEKLHLPDQLAINHFLTLEGQKFSKSRGVFIDPRALVEKVGLDPVRFYMAYLSPEASDADFTHEGIKGVTNSILAAKVGNFVHRSLTLSKDLELTGADRISPEVKEETARLFKEAQAALERVQIRRYVTTIVQLADYANRFISIKQPWDLKKTTSPRFNMTEFNSVMTDCLFLTEALAVLCHPVIPSSSQKIESMLGLELRTWPDGVVEHLERKLKTIKISSLAPLFSRIE